MKAPKQLDLTELGSDEFASDEPPLDVFFRITTMPPPAAFENLKKLRRLGILNGEALLALIAQAPIDPINLMGTLMHVMPDGWAFSAIDFSMFRVLARNAKKAVSAALRVDLMGGAIQALVLNKANQLTEFRTLEVTPGEDSLPKIQTLCDEALLASKREDWQ